MTQTDYAYGKCREKLKIRQYNKKDIYLMYNMYYISSQLRQGNPQYLICFLKIELKIPHA